ncbi:MAG: hypothetical protein A2940_01345 [Candidatus Wildermuthbacteria bacterium RIFCSPLOWO2_01_FULL_48_29]|uniref:DNA recombination protein RmuC n=2 Tax=Candidatus Wildermuthiibacteriota TaxID=1817923 RepID=A0A1G2RLI1_9BACT|nr:MAG: hypothetical protein A2843_01850 [Candidatus Wildermuthbacteria bacterium RIFCSPHIGHO2_01_FULL_48_27b]OHA73348.1 MAG: hypothetical protein A2940_01345 [Candidatus Wildermuthbacteria bacterium RIFCSPLOWO2_01_FULL_48_29]
MSEILLIGIIALLAGIIVFLLRRGQTKEDSSSFLLMQNQMGEMRTILDTRLGDSTKMFQQQYSESVRVIQDITEKLTRLDETNKQVIGFTDQLQSLQDILKNPKQRGILGEYYLETLLKNVLPPTGYKMQYAFSDGTIVDAAIFVKDKIIPVDSKFSIENYNRLVEEKDPLEKERLEKLFKSDLKNRIDETAKYVKPAEGTMEFAFMFIPHEAIYFDLLIAQVGTVKLNTRDLIEYAFRDKHVIIVSPTNFLAYLQTVLQGLKALQIEESAKEIRKKVEDLGRHLGSYEQFMLSLGRSLETSVNQYNRASHEFRKIDKDVLRITGSSNEVEVLELDHPESKGD